MANNIDLSINGVLKKIATKESAGVHTQVFGLDAEATSSIGEVAEPPPATDIDPSGLNGRLQRIAQHLSSLMTLFPAALTAGGNLRAAILEALPAGANLLGKVAIDQSQPGTTNSVAISSGGSAFYPSSYLVETTATTTAAGQSDILATGTSRLRVANLDATNNLRIAFGTSAQDAEANVASGMIIFTKSVDLVGVPANATHYAWLAAAATASIQIIQGV
jgi:hypothetical protein